jgi:3-oxoacyl-[acyl-carrier protein] reductase
MLRESNTLEGGDGMGRLQGKVALVTGASRGIGAAIARRLAADGAKVVVNYAKSANVAEEVVRQIKSAGGEATAVQADLSDPSQIQPLFDATLQVFGRLDILVNNAGVAEMRPLERFDEKHFTRHFDLNVKGVLHACREAARHFGDGGGTIINVSSHVPRMAIPGLVVYTATKAAVDAITRVLAAELGSRQITVNAVCPGLTETDMNRDLDPTIREQMVRQTALGRLGRPEDIADVVAFLACDDARWVTGELLGATGGLRG